MPKKQTSTSNWIRGHGYYNAKDHDTPLSEDEFIAMLRESQPRLSEAIARKRYRTYCISWSSYHEAKE